MFGSDTISNFNYIRISSTFKAIIQFPTKRLSLKGGKRNEEIVDTGLIRYVSLRMRGRGEGIRVLAA